VPERGATEENKKHEKSEEEKKQKKKCDKPKEKNEVQQCITNWIYSDSLSLFLCRLA
jgi:hypothetical protein